MISATACTLELDNPVAAASELAAQINKQLTLQKNSIGLILGDSDMDFAALNSELKKNFDFNIFGCTSAGMFGINEGYEEFCITLLVLSANDCDFHLECSALINKNSALNAIETAYRAGETAIGGRPKLVIALAPRISDVFLDLYPDIVGEISNGVPVFGGIPSASPGGKEFIFINDEIYTNRAVFLFITGNVRPYFCACNLFDNIAEQKRRITKAEGNILYRVGDQTFLEYAKSLGLRFDFDDPDTRSFAFVSHPLLIEENTGDGNSISFVRTIGDVNLEEGYVVTLGKVPQGALMSIGVLRKGEITRSAEIGVQEISQLLENSDNDYKYSTMLCVSCIGRSMVMAPNIDLEGKLVQSALGNKLKISGFYAWGEICPTAYTDETAINCGHDETLSLCVF